MTHVEKGCMEIRASKTALQSAVFAIQTDTVKNVTGGISVICVSKYVRLGVRWSCVYRTLENANLNSVKKALVGRFVTNVW